MKITGIPTKYSEVQFRSRLEAKWAAFFDLCGWSWEYEPFDLDGWIPDFLIRGHTKDILVEVKPVTRFPADLARRLEDRSVDHTLYNLLILGCAFPVAPIEDEDGAHNLIGWFGATQGHIEYFGREVIFWENALFGLSPEVDADDDLGLCGLDPTNQITGYESFVPLDDGGVGKSGWREASNKVQWRAPV